MNRRGIITVVLLSGLPFLLPFVLVVIAEGAVPSFPESAKYLLAGLVPAALLVLRAQNLTARPARFRWAMVFSALSTSLLGALSFGAVAVAGIFGLLFALGGLLLAATSAAATHMLRDGGKLAALSAVLSIIATLPLGIWAVVASAAHGSRGYDAAHLGGWVMIGSSIAVVTAMILSRLAGNPSP